MLAPELSRTQARTALRESCCVLAASLLHANAQLASMRVIQGGPAHLASLLS